MSSDEENTSRYHMKTVVYSIITSDSERFVSVDSRFRILYGMNVCYRISVFNIVHKRAVKNYSYHYFIRVLYFLLGVSGNTLN